MIVANVETKQMYIKAEIKIKQIKIINYKIFVNIL